MPSQHLYTIILEFRSGTYVAQVSSTSALDACRCWADMPNPQDLESWQLTREQLRQLVRNDHPIALTGLTGTWCISGSIGGHFALINIIQTAQAPQPATPSLA